MGLLLRKYERKKRTLSKTLSLNLDLIKLFIITECINNIFNKYLMYSL